MRLALLSDIHANLPALEAVITDMAQFNVDHVVVAGDSINWGPFSTQVIERIINERWAVIRGNHEMYLLEYQRENVPEHRQVWTLPPYHRATIPAYWQYVIGSLPDALTLYYPDLPPVQVAHAAPGNHFTGIYPQTPEHEIEAMLDGTEPRTVIVGHTHLPTHLQIGRWQVINPGAVGLPLNGVPGASYALLDGDADGWRPTFRHIEYDQTALLDEFERIEHVKHHGSTGYLAINEFRTARPLIVGYHSWMTAQNPHADRESIAFAEQYVESDLRWEYLHPLYRVNLPQTYDWKT